MCISAVFLAVLGALFSMHVCSQSPSRVVQQGVKEGFQTCAPRLDRVVNSLHEEGSNYADVGTWSRVTPDSKATIRPYSDGTSFASVSEVLNRAGDCDTALTQILPMLTMSCAAVRETAFRSGSISKTWTALPSMN